MDWNKLGYLQMYEQEISRKLLDFDFEKVCSVTLATTNVYACLACGKYYQGAINLIKRCFS